MTEWITVGYLLATVLTFGVGYIADRTMERALTAAWTCGAFVVLVLPLAYWLPAAASAVCLAALVAAPPIIAALNGALLHTLVQPEAVARGTGIYSGFGTILSAIGPVTFGALINSLDGEFWGGFVFLALLNLAGAVCYFALHRTMIRAAETIPAAAMSPARASRVSAPPTD
jgi:cyanate permease